MIQTLKNLYHLFLGIIANIYYSYPSRRLKVIGITGTDGKTTTTHLVYSILKAAGKKASMISSVYANIAGKTYDTGFHVTTPDIFPLYKYLRESLDSGDEYFVLETTSHSLYQNRVYGIIFDLGILTNVTHEHLDMHKSMEEYTRIKASLLARAKIALTNADDSSYFWIKNHLQRKIYTYGLKNKSDFSLDLEKKLDISLPEFNKYNYLAAYAASILLQIPKDKILSSLKNFRLPVGRLEIIAQKPIVVINDFAHTPNAINQVLKSVKEKYIKKEQRFIHVFGSAAKRDSSKRPFMGEQSAKFASVIILTEEDYRNENPDSIAKEIAQGIEKAGFKFVHPDKLNNQSNKVYTIIINRKEAIETAVKITKKGDVVIATGKGHEKSLSRGNKEYPWDESQELRDAVRKKLKLINNAV